MVDREQTDARRLAEQIAHEQDVARDRLTAFAVFLVAAAAIGLSGAFSQMGTIADENGLMASVPMGAAVAIPIAIAVFGFRRAASAERTRTILSNLTTHDPLTALPNRRFLGGGFEALAAQTHRRGSRMAVLFLDLEGLRQVNTRFGYEVGDQILIQTVSRIRSVLREGDVVVRYSGDAFVVLCPDVSTKKSGEAIAGRLLGAIIAPLEHDGFTFHLDANIGLAISSEHPEDLLDVLEDADIALYQAKQAGIGAVMVYDESARGMLTPSNAYRRLGEALANGEFTVYYEPIVSLWTKRLVGVEALLRWDDPSRGMVRPEEFVPLLEETGLIIPVGEWFIEQVMMQSKAWEQRFPGRPALNVKINVSPKQLTNQHFVASIERSLASTGSRPDNICLEFAEAAMNADTEVAWSNLHQARKVGLTLGLDEFGTGYSSLSLLRSFNIDLLKLDDSLVDQITGSKEDLTIVEHTVAMARSLGIATVAYGVHSEQQVELLRSLNCDLGQGPFFSPPQPPAVIEKLLGGDPRDDEWRPEAKAGATPSAQLDGASHQQTALDDKPATTET